MGPMPELPEVEVARLNLSRWATGRRVATVEAEATRVLRPAGPRALSALVGAQVVSVDRTGKALLVRLAGRRGAVGLYSHLGMTGKWVRRAAGEPTPHSRARLALDDGKVLHYVDPRMFGRLLVVPRARFEALPAVSQLSPDPLRDGIDAARLGQRLVATRRAVKVALLDQKVLAGVGNIQAAEALFRARIDPRRLAADLTRGEVVRLAEGVLGSVRRTLEAFRAEGVLSDEGEVTYVEEGGDNPFLVYDREGEACPRCRRARIERIVQSGRSTFLCPRCQR